MSRVDNFLRLAEAFNNTLRKMVIREEAVEEPRKTYMSPRSCPVRALWKNLHCNPDSNFDLTEDQRKQISHYEMVQIFNNHLIEPLLKSIHLQIENISSQPGEAKTNSLPQALYMSQKLLVDAWQPLKDLSQRIYNGLGLDNEAKEESFWYLDSQDQADSARNLFEGLDTAMDFSEKLLMRIPFLLTEEKKDLTHFFRVANKLHPLLEQFSMLNIIFLLNHHAEINDLDDNMLSLQKNLSRDPRIKLNLSSWELYYDTNGIQTDRRFLSIISPRANSIRAMKEVGEDFPLMDQGCPAFYVQIPVKDVPKEIIPEGFESHGPNINLIKLFYFHFLYLLKHNLGY